MNCGMPELLLKLLPTNDATGETDRRAADYLRCLHAIGASRTAQANFLDSARAAVELIVEHCADVPLAAVYRVEQPHRRAALTASAGTSPRGMSPPRWLEPSCDEPVRAAVDGAAGRDAQRTVPLLVGGTQVVGWLWFEAIGDDTSARALLMASVA